MKDNKIFSLIKKEENRQSLGIELIPSENYASPSVREVLSSYFVNKYSEGYPKKRYYGGNEYVDEVELIAQERAKKLFGVPFVNVQPYSGSPANLAVYMATCNPGDTVMGQSLIAGGHLTHGHNVSASGIFYKAVQYGVKKRTQALEDMFDYGEIRRLVLHHKPKLIWVGATAYPLKIHYEKFAEIADEVGAYIAADISHIAGLIAGGVHPSPVPHVHIVTTTTHKTLRGPRGAMIMVTDKGMKKDPDLGAKVNRAVFPGLQGGPHDNQTGAIAVALFEALLPSFKKYAHQIVKNSSALADELMRGGLTLVGGGSQNHLLLIDFTPTMGPGAGIFIQKALDFIGLTANKNTVPEEESSPFYPSGLRLGTPAATTRGMKEKEMRQIGRIILRAVREIHAMHLPKDKEERVAVMKRLEGNLKKNKTLVSLRKEVRDIAKRFPIK